MNEIWEQTCCMLVCLCAIVQTTNHVRTYVYTCMCTRARMYVAGRERAGEERRQWEGRRKRQTGDKRTTEREKDTPKWERARTNEWKMMWQRNVLVMGTRFETQYDLWRHTNNRFQFDNKMGVLLWLKKIMKGRYRERKRERESEGGWDTHTRTHTASVRLRKICVGDERLWQKNFTIISDVLESHTIESNDTTYREWGVENRVFQPLTTCVCVCMCARVNWAVGQPANHIRNCVLSRRTVKLLSFYADLELKHYLR